MSKYAFPSAHDPKTGVAQIGMTLRDYFAAKAMQAVFKKSILDATSPLTTAEAAYMMADAMLKERDETPKFNALFDKWLKEQDEAPRPSNLVDGDNVNP
jgi:hypothetical protein